MAQPSPEEAFVLPSVVFRPVLLSILCTAVGALAIGLAAMADALMFGVYFAIGLALGLGNALLVKFSVSSITAKENPAKARMALNSATRLLIVTAIALVIAFVFRPYGFGVLFGLALFQVLLVFSTVIPVWRKIRRGEAYVGEASTDSATDTSGTSTISTTSAEQHG
jgi:hypothetical protein